MCRNEDLAALIESSDLLHSKYSACAGVEVCCKYGSGASMGVVAVCCICVRVCVWCICLTGCKLLRDLLRVSKSLHLRRL